MPHTTRFPRAPRPRMAVVALMLFLVVLVTGAAPASADPPTITRFEASVTDVNLVTMTWASTGGDSSNLAYISGPRMQGIGTQDVGFLPQNGSVKFRAGPGRHKYTIQVNNDAGETMTRSVLATVGHPESPRVTSANPVRLSVFDAGQPVTVALATAGSPTEVQITRPDGARLTTISPVGATASFTIPAADVGALPFGKSTFHLKACRRGTTTVPGQPHADPTTICGQASRVTVIREASRFDGPYRELLAAPRDLPVSWNGTGRFWYVTVDGRLLGDSHTTTPSATIPAAWLTPGVHQVRLVTCTLARGCSDDHKVTTPVAGTVEVIGVTPGQGVLWGPANDYSTKVAHIRTASGSLEPVYSRYNGTTSTVDVAVGQTVAVGDSLATLKLTEHSHEMKEVIVGENVNWTRTSWRSAFAATSRSYDFAPYGDSIQNQIDVAFDDQGKLWALGEANKGVAAMSGNTVEIHDAPLARVFDASTNTFTPVEPFVYGATNRNSISGTGERIINADGKIWWVQGGSFHAAGEARKHNHSRIISFDTAGRDLLTTPEDERLCAVNLPGGDNTAQSLAWDGQRMWFSEGKGGGRSAVGWFDPDTMPCGNLYDYDAAAAALDDDDPATNPPPTTPVCAAGATAGCLHRIVTPDLGGPTVVTPREIREVTQITVDPDGSTIWFTDYNHGDGQIGSYRPDSPGATTGRFTTYPAPKPARDASGNYRAKPWQIRADARYVYFTSFDDSSVVRLDKNRADDPACQALVAGVNPCMQAIHIPAPHGRMYSHSIELDTARGRLWFTNRPDVVAVPERDQATGGEKTGTVIGFIDTATWRSGTVYTGLDEIAPATSLRFRALGFSGIALNPTTGQIGLASPRHASLLNPL